jgi:hypothetical protein
VTAGQFQSHPTAQRIAHKVSLRDSHAIHVGDEKIREGGWVHWLTGIVRRLAVAREIDSDHFEL